MNSMVRNAPGASCIITRSKLLIKLIEKVVRGEVHHYKCATAPQIDLLKQWVPHALLGFHCALLRDRKPPAPTIDGSCATATAH